MAATATSDAFSGAALKESMRPKTLRVGRRCRLDELAFRLFGDSEVAWVLCDLNPNLSPDTWLEAGQSLHLPNAEQARRAGFRFASGRSDWNHEDKCLRLVRGGDSSKRAAIDSFVDQALRSGCSPDETAAYLTETSTREMISEFLQAPSATDFATRVKAEVQNRCITARTRQALRRWSDILAQTVSPVGWLCFLQSMASSPHELSSLLRTLAIPEPLILVARRLAPMVLGAATQSAAARLEPSVYRARPLDNESAALSAKIPLQISLASGVPLMHPTHLPSWGGAELHRQISTSFRRVREALSRVEREWDVLPVELRACFSNAEAGAFPISNVQGQQARILKIFAGLQASYASKIPNSECQHLGLSALLAVDSQVAQDGLRSWQLTPSQEPKDELVQAITHRLATEMLRFIDQSAHRWLCLKSNWGGEIHPRRLRTMLTVSRDVRPDGDRVGTILESWFQTQRVRTGQPRRTRSVILTPEHIYTFAKRLKQPIPVAGYHLSDFGLAALLAGCGQSRWESSWMHPDVDETLTLSLLNRFAPRVLCAVEKQIAERNPVRTNTKSPERARGVAYALRA